MAPLQANWFEVRRWTKNDTAGGNTEVKPYAYDARLSKTEKLVEDFMRARWQETGTGNTWPCWRVFFNVLISESHTHTYVYWAKSMKETEEAVFSLKSSLTLHLQTHYDYPVS